MTKFPYLAGEWYIVITCRGCNERHPVFHDLTKGAATITPVYIWRCPYCNYKDSYEGEAVERYQHPAPAVARKPDAAT